MTAHHGRKVSRGDRCLTRSVTEIAGELSPETRLERQVLPRDRHTGIRQHRTRERNMIVERRDRRFMRSRAPVSYTHLDVYKRQVEHGENEPDEYGLTRPGRPADERMAGILATPAVGIFRVAGVQREVVR